MQHPLAFPSIIAMEAIESCINCHSFIIIYYQQLLMLLFSNLCQLDIAAVACSLVRSVSLCSLYLPSKPSDSNAFQIDFSLFRRRRILQPRNESHNSLAVVQFKLLLLLACLLVSQRGLKNDFHVHFERYHQFINNTTMAMMTTTI